MKTHYEFNNLTRGLSSQCFKGKQTFLGLNEIFYFYFHFLYLYYFIILTFV